MPLQKVLGGYRVTLPQKFREKNKISVGDFVDVEQTNSYVTIMAVEVEVKEKKA